MHAVTSRSRTPAQHGLLNTGTTTITKRRYAVAVRFQVITKVTSLTDVFCLLVCQL